MFTLVGTTLIGSDTVDKLRYPLDSDGDPAVRHATAFIQP
jgi:hypothetical protein